MYSKVRSLGVRGVTGYEVTVECSISSGLPAVEVVGLPDTAIKEARERVRSAVKNSGAKFPVSRVVLNLAPADTKKSGTAYDLPLLVGILSASGELPKPDEDAAYLGELSLEGKLRPVSGMLPMVMAARSAGIRSVYVPAENGPEASLVQGVTVYPVESITQLREHMTGETPIQPAKKWVPQPNLTEYPDFCEVKGQQNAKRALEIAAAGGHNILMVGPPGSGKSMLAKRLPGILPDMTLAEALEATAIHSVAGLTNSAHPMLTSRPFRSPHHTISAPGMAGGSTTLRPGEVSLAHNGVLFLDELPEFRIDALEVMRQPLEDGQTTVTRVSGSVTYPSRFMLVCAMNPCKCGWYGTDRCTCTDAAVKKYLSKLSGPLIDRIDMIIEVEAVEFSDLTTRSTGETSAVIKERVNKARAVQAQRFRGSSTKSNAAMSTVQSEEFCRLDETSKALMEGAFNSLQLTARSYDRILRVARTIADLEGEENIGPEHLAEAIQYRTYNIGRK